MSQKDTFGLRMRAARQRRGLSLEAIATKTKVPVSLWEGMERNDLGRWPSGLFARAYIRDYATLVGLDVDETVDEFCRHFPNGDRRRGQLMRAHADVLDTRSQYADDTIPATGDRRAAASNPPPPPRIPAVIRHRALGALCDLLLVGGAALAISAASHSGILIPLAVVAVFYFSVSTAWLGRTPGLVLILQLAARIPQLVRVGERRLSARAHPRPS